MAEMVKAMLALWDQLREDAEQGRVVLAKKAPGEPPVCEDPRGQRAYVSAVLPEPVVPRRPPPASRVVVPATT
jgi:hypothetical protein